MKFITVLFCLVHVDNILSYSTLELYQSADVEARKQEVADFNKVRKLIKAFYVISSIFFLPCYVNFCIG